MEISVSTLEESITKRLKATHVEVQDMSGMCPFFFFFFLHIVIASAAANTKKIKIKIKKKLKFRLC